MRFADRGSDAELAALSSCSKSEKRKWAGVVDEAETKGSLVLSPAGAERSGRSEVTDDDAILMAESAASVRLSISGGRPSRWD